MGEGKIDRAAWADVVAELVTTETRGKKAPFARMVGVDARTLDRWLHQEVDVREESVRAVARGLGRTPMDLLVRVGYYQISEITPPTPIDPRQDPVIQTILSDPQWSEDERTELVKQQIDRIERDQAQRLADYEWIVKRRRDAS